VSEEKTMKYDFDRIIDRRNTSSLKWDYCSSDELPLWVADMDFESPREVIDVIIERARHGVFGYTAMSREYHQAVINWMKKHQGWEIKREWIIPTPGVIPDLSIAILAFTNPGDGVIIQPPVYHIFEPIIRNNGRQVVENPLKQENGRYVMDYKALEDSFIFGARNRLFILCSPHNPVGRVWERDELKRLAEICIKHDVILISDEIHSDLIMEGHQHTPLASLSEEIADNVVTCTSASKTFNLAGLECSNVIITNRKLSSQFSSITENLWIRRTNIFGMVATQAAYTHGEKWLAELLVYLKRNYDFVVSYLGEHLPEVQVTPLEGTYLVWLDFRALGISDSDMKDLLRSKARVLLEDGEVFGTGGRGFQRINIACPHAVLKEALTRIATALQGR
jgi:cystathionine beta-lyase